MIPAPLGFFEVARELVGANPALFSQPRLGKAPEGFDAVDVAFAPREFVFMVMHAMMFEPIPDQSVIRLPAVGVDGRRAFDLAMHHP